MKQFCPVSSQKGESANWLFKDYCFFFFLILHHILSRFLSLTELNNIDKLNVPDFDAELPHYIWRLVGRATATKPNTRTYFLPTPPI